MGIQSTIEISREQAERMWVDKYLEEYRIRIEGFAKMASNRTLEDSIEETFYNYRITP